MTQLMWAATLGGSKERVWASGSSPGFRSWLVEAAWGWFVLSLGVGRVWPLTGSSRLQDSDGDKSDDLVVDVSNEVRAGSGWRAALGVGVPPLRVLLCPGCCPDVTGSLRGAVRPLELGHQAGWESRAGLCHMVPRHTRALRDFQRETPRDRRVGPAFGPCGSPDKLCSVPHPGVWRWGL